MNKDDDHSGGCCCLAVLVLGACLMAGIIGYGVYRYRSHKVEHHD